MNRSLLLLFILALFFPIAWTQTLSASFLRKKYLKGQESSINKKKEKNLKADFLRPKENQKSKTQSNADDSDDLGDDEPDFWNFDPKRNVKPGSDLTTQKKEDKERKNEYGTLTEKKFQKEVNDLLKQVDSFFN